MRLLAIEWSHHREGAEQVLKLRLKNGANLAPGRLSAVEPAPEEGTPVVSSTVLAGCDRARDGRAQAASGVTTAVQFGQRRATTEISVAHSGQVRVFGEMPFISWYFLYGMTTKK